MQAVRHLLAQRHLVVLLCAVTLLLKLVVPYGYMIDAGQGRFAVIPCAGTMPPPKTMMSMHAMDGAKDHGQKDHGMADQPCAFAGFSAAALGTIDPIQLAALIVFILATGLVLSVPPAPAALLRLRPPAHGPPAAL